MMYRMAKVWKIRGWDGDKLIFEREVAGNLSEPEVSTMLQRLACRHLSDAEIIRASLRKNDPDYAGLLERVGTRNPICYGHSLQFTAELKDQEVGLDNES